MLISCFCGIDFISYKFILQQYKTEVDDGRRKKYRLHADLAKQNYKSKDMLFVYLPIDHGTPLFVSFGTTDLIGTRSISIVFNS